MGEELVPIAAVQLVEIRISLYARKSVVMLITKVVTEKEATGNNTPPERFIFTTTLLKPIKQILPSLLFIGVAGLVGNKGGYV